MLPAFFPIYTILVSHQIFHHVLLDLSKGLCICYRYHPFLILGLEFQYHSGQHNFTALSHHIPVQSYVHPLSVMFCVFIQPFHSACCLTNSRFRQSKLESFISLLIGSVFFCSPPLLILLVNTINLFFHKTKLYSFHILLK